MSDKTRTRKAKKNLRKANTEEEEGRLMVALGVDDDGGGGDGFVSSCDPGMTSEECQLAMIKTAVRRIEDNRERDAKNKKKEWNARFHSRDKMQVMIDILEKFMVSRKVLVYGGTAINDILPKEAQFYDRSAEIPDYDFFSADAMGDARLLCDIYARNGYAQVEAKAGVHFGTVKVFVNSIGIADITQIPYKLYRNLCRSALTRNGGIRYCPPDFLRMMVFSELCKPKGDTSRWQKVYSRFMLLNKYHPFSLRPHKLRNCARQTPSVAVVGERTMTREGALLRKLQRVSVRELVGMKVVFFGAFAFAQYARLADSGSRNSVPDSDSSFSSISSTPTTSGYFDVLAEDIESTATGLAEKLSGVLRGREKGGGGDGSKRKGGGGGCGRRKVELIRHKRVMDHVPKHIVVKVGKYRIATIYEAWHCFNFNRIELELDVGEEVGEDVGGDGGSGGGGGGGGGGMVKKKEEVNIATMDTLMYFYLMFVYMEKPEYDQKKLICMSHFFMKLIIEKPMMVHRKGIFRRFNDDCYGNEVSLSDLKLEKNRLFQDEYPKKKHTWFFKMMFFKYKP